ncbi:MAG: PEP-CTERM sorting domain-containing protein [Pseudomonadota bacterium]
MKFLLTSTALAVGVFTISAQVAAADCAPDSLGAGETSTCTGVDTDGFKDGSDAITVIVDSGALVSQSISDENTIDVDGLNATVVNDGTIINRPAADPNNAIAGGEGLTVENYGLIDSADDAIDNEGTNNLTVLNDGTILADDKGIQASDGLHLTNAFEILTFDEAVEAGDDAYIENGLFGVIASEDDDAVQIEQNAQIYNEGEIIGADDGIDIDSGYINNSGDIIALVGSGVDIDDDGNAIVEVDNSGAIIAQEYGILADPANAQGQVISNSGGVIGLQGAFSLGAGNDVVTLQEDGVFLRDMLFGGDDDYFNINALNFLLADVPFTSLDQLNIDTVPPLEVAVADGGTGTDRLEFSLFNQASVSVSAITDGFAFDFFNADVGAFTFHAINFEEFVFAGSVVSASVLASAAAPAPVPLPASLLLLGGALAGLALRRKS